MNIPQEVAMHEGGHLFVGLVLGIQEQGIAFVVGAGESAQAWFSDRDAAKSLRRSLAGLLAQLIVLPDSLEPHLREAYQHSIIFTTEHPYFSKITEEERSFVSGARTDLEMARNYAAKLHPNSPADALACLRDAEVEIRTLLKRRAGEVVQIATDIVAWSNEPERVDEPWPMYPPQRAAVLMKKR